MNIRLDNIFGHTELLHGLPIVTSPHCIRRVPSRVHDKRRHSDTYHARIQKKWNKRFGMREEPIFMLVDNHAVGLVQPRGKVIVAHPDYVAAVRGLISDAGGN